MPQEFGDVDADRSIHEKHISRMVDYYKRTATNYDSHFDNEDYGHNRAVQEMLSIISVTGSKSLLDVCCGTGRGVKAALDKGLDVVGVDISPDLLKTGVNELGIPSDRLRIADATQLPFEDNSFDVSCVFGALHHAAMPSQIVKEMIRVSRRAIVISDGGNTFSGGAKRVLIRLGIFEPIYRLIFRRSPRTSKRELDSEGDGPTFSFSIEEVIPILESAFENSKALVSYKVKKYEVWSYKFPRAFARGVIFTAWNKNK